MPSLVSIGLLAFVLLPATLEACAPAEPDHIGVQMQRLSRIEELFAASKAEDAKAFAEAEAAKLRAQGGNDPVRDADVLELAVQVANQSGDYKAAVEPAHQLVALRRDAIKTEPFLFSLAVHEQSVALAGTEQQVAVDTAIQAAVADFRANFANDDIRRAEGLEAQAGVIAQVFSRPLVAIDLRREALEVRRKAKDVSKQDTADALRSLGLLEMRDHQLDKAEQHLHESAQDFLDLVPGASTKQRAADLRDAAASLELARAGIALRQGRATDVATLIGKADRMGTPERAPDRELLETTLRQTLATYQGDLPLAAELAVHNAELAAAPADADPGIAADAIEDAGHALLAAGDVTRAKVFLENALSRRNTLGEPTWSCKLGLSEVAERQGQAADADRYRTQAMQEKKSGMSEVPILFGTNRAPVGAIPGRFAGDMGPGLAFGEAVVLVPGGPESTEAQVSDKLQLTAMLSPSTDYERLILVKPSILSASEFAARAGAKAGRAYGRTALVFVHGFDTAFESAVKRAGQLARDIGFDGPVFVFSWPSQGQLSLAGYRADETSAVASAPALLQFLKAVETATGAEKIHIVAHSMGNQVVLKALADLEASGPPELKGKVGELVFASPDVDAGDFKRETAQLRAAGMTLYATSQDAALNVSWLANLFSRRAGSVSWGLLSSGTPVIVAGVESINVSAAGPELLATNHDLYARNAVITDDLRKILQRGAHPPDARDPAGFKRCETAGGAFWVYVAPDAAPGRPCP